MSAIQQGASPVLKQLVKYSGKKLHSSSMDNAGYGAINSGNSYMRLVNNDKMSNFAIKMITTQLRYQTPLDPVDSKSMLESFLQMFSMEAMNSIKNSFDNWNKSQKSDPLHKASNLLNKRIFYNEDSIRFGATGADAGEAKLLNADNNWVFLDDNIDIKQKLQVKIYDYNGELLKETQSEAKNLGYVPLELAQKAKEGLAPGSYSVKISAFNHQGEQLEIPLLKVGSVARVSRDGEATGDAMESCVLHMDNGEQIRSFNQIWAIEHGVSQHLLGAGSGGEGQQLGGSAAAQASGVKRGHLAYLKATE